VSQATVPWKTISKKQLLHTKYIDVWEDIVEKPDGKHTSYFVVRKEPFSIVIPLVGTDIYMVRQYRYAVSSVSLEFPMGYVAGKNPREIAEIELKEETGITAKSLKELSKFWLAKGFTNEVGYIYLAEDLTFGTPQPEEGEFIDIEKYSVAEIGQKIMSGEIIDGSTIVAYHFLEKYLQK